MAYTVFVVSNGFIIRLDENVGVAVDNSNAAICTHPNEVGGIIMQMESERMMRQTVSLSALPQLNATASGYLEEVRAGLPLVNPVPRVNPGPPTPKEEIQENRKEPTATRIGELGMMLDEHSWQEEDDSVTTETETESGEGDRTGISLDEESSLGKSM